jgi:hypothetical protein
MIQRLEKAQAFRQQLKTNGVLRTGPDIPQSFDKDSLIESHLFAAVSGRAKVAATIRGKAMVASAYT